MAGGCKSSPEESDYLDPEVLATHYNGEKFVGSSACLECHPHIHAQYTETAHYHTSAPASLESIVGTVNQEAIWELGDSEITLFEKDGSIFERKSFKARDLTLTTKLDITVGSGGKGQSFLYWNGDRLYQLQTSFYAPTEQWINSPNFPTTSVERPVTDACLKCHFTFARNRDSTGRSNRYLKESLLYGIACERCHRPAYDHVVHHRKHPESTEARFMTLLDTLSRQQRLDVCVQCHSGLRARQVKGNPFSFLAGERLDSYSKNYHSGRPQAELDVHGNQYGLLASSACFQKSDTMDCTTCHSPHEDRRGNSSFFNARCASCHADDHQGCKADSSLRSSMGNDCIACHMPLAPSRTMKMQLKPDKEEVPVLVRSHLIKVYPQTITEH